MYVFDLCKQGILYTLNYTSKTRKGSSGGSFHTPYLIIEQATVAGRRIVSPIPLAGMQIKPANSTTKKVTPIALPQAYDYVAILFPDQETLVPNGLVGFLTKIEPFANVNQLERCLLKFKNVGKQDSIEELINLTINKAYSAVLVAKKQSELLSKVNQ